MLTVGAAKLAKQSGNQSQLCMIQVMPMGSEKVKAHETDNVQDMKGDPSLLGLLSDFKKLFEEHACLPPSRGFFDHRIVLKAGTEPMNKSPYRYPSVKKDVIEGLVQQMLDQGIIQPSYSPFASPVVLVGKKDGSWRLCVDYRNLNKFFVKNKFPIPIVEDLLDELGGSKIFSKIDGGLDITN
uniref:Reverse transcriptase domain-containing protein n=1 Tax=Solanum lycopersicum TaxID=4081 RepID=A0A3Q7JVP6_SOLLC